MPRDRKKMTDKKEDALREHGTLNPRAEEVDDPRFAERDFFDARDMVQVKYEMLRRVEAEGCTVTEAATRFGLSRPTYYAVKSDFDRNGVVGLLPRKRGPRGRHKLTDEVMEFLEGQLRTDHTLSSKELVSRIEGRFGRQVHPRTIERALERREKKR